MFEKKPGKWTDMLHCRRPAVMYWLLSANEREVTVSSPGGLFKNYTFALSSQAESNLMNETQF